MTIGCEDLESDPDLKAWREERMQRHRRSSFETEQIQFLRLNLPPSAVNMKGSVSAYTIKGGEATTTSTTSPPPHRRTRKISLAGIASPSLRKRRLSRAGTKVADMVRSMGTNNNNNNPQVTEGGKCCNNIATTMFSNPINTKRLKHIFYI